MPKASNQPDIVAWWKFEWGHEYKCNYYWRQERPVIQNPRQKQRKDCAPKDADWCDCFPEGGQQGHCRQETTISTVHTHVYIEAVCMTVHQAKEDAALEYNQHNANSRSSTHAK
jgi:hypothetical protein